MDKINRKILEALNDERYKARTIKGVASTVSLAPKLVIARINSSPELVGAVKVYPRRAKDGQVLITTKQKFSKTASMKDKFIDAFATNRVSLKDEY